MKKRPRELSISVEVAWRLNANIVIDLNFEFRGRIYVPCLRV